MWLAQWTACVTVKYKYGFWMKFMVMSAKRLDGTILLSLDSSRTLFCHVISVSMIVCCPGNLLLFAWIYKPVTKDVCLRKWGRSFTTVSIWVSATHFHHRLWLEETSELNSPISAHVCFAQSIYSHSFTFDWLAASSSFTSARTYVISAWIKP